MRSRTTTGGVSSWRCRFTPSWRCRTPHGGWSVQFWGKGTWWGRGGKQHGTGVTIIRHCEHLHLQRFLPRAMSTRARREPGGNESLAFPSPATCAQCAAFEPSTSSEVHLQVGRELLLRRRQRQPTAARRRADGASAIQLRGCAVRWRQRRPRRTSLLVVVARRWRGQEVGAVRRGWFEALPRSAAPCPAPPPAGGLCTQERKGRAPHARHAEVPPPRLRACPPPGSASLVHERPTPGVLRHPMWARRWADRQVCVSM